MTFFRDLAALIQFSGFRRLFEVRLLSEGSSGIFQVALASTVLFSRREFKHGSRAMRSCLQSSAL
jgi:hypothetical protein